MKNIKLCSRYDSVNCRYKHRLLQCFYIHRANKELNANMCIYEAEVLPLKKKQTNKQPRPLKFQKKIDTFDKRVNNVLAVKHKWDVLQ